MLHLATASAQSGPVNLVGPNPATSKEVTTALALDMHRPHFLRLPRFALVFALRTAAEELLLADQRAAPEALRQDGFVFEATTAGEAVAAALAHR